MRKRKIFMLWLISVLWLCVLVRLSSQDGAATAETSKRLAVFLVTLFQLPADQTNQINMSMRTGAHGAVFFVLGWLVYEAARITVEKWKRPGIRVIAVCSVIAILDEVKKIYITGRHLSWPEAGLNIAGVCLGVGIAVGIRHLKRKKRGNPPKEPLAQEEKDEPQTAGDVPRAPA